MLPLALRVSTTVSVESSTGHEAPIVWQALQALHSSLEASAGLSHVPAGQHASHDGHALPPEPEPEEPPHPAPGAATHMVTDVIFMSNAALLSVIVSTLPAPSGRASTSSFAVLPVGEVTSAR